MKYSRIALVFVITALACLLNALVLTAGGGSLPDDEEFLRKAAASAMKEFELGQLAAINGEDNAVKSFGRRVVTDRITAVNKLKTLAARKGVTMPWELDPASRSAVDRLSNLVGAEFDRAYLEMTCADHENVLVDFSAQADSGADREVKAFAAQRLPTLETHLRTARSTMAKLK